MIGADVVGMSTTLEVIACNHMGLPAAALSVITDECDPDNLQQLDMADLLKSAAKAEEGLIVIFRKLVSSL
jgi:purine-nucleoside phosphorylase